MKMFRTNLILGAKIFCSILMLFLCSHLVFSQVDPKLDYRVTDFRYDATIGANGSLVFNLQMKAGQDYLAAVLPMDGADVFIEYSLDAGVVLGPPTTNLPIALPSPNPILISLLFATLDPWPTAGFPDNYLVVSMSKAPAGTPIRNDFTEEFVNVGTVFIPIISGAGNLTAASYLEVVNSGTGSTGPGPFFYYTSSSWSSSRAPGISRRFDIACPAKVYLGEPSSLEFDMQLVYCTDETPGTLPVQSISGITGTWDPATVETGTPGTFYYTFTPDNPIFCDEVIAITISDGTGGPEVDDIDGCVGMPLDLMSAVVVGGTNPAGYEFFSYDGSVYTPIPSTITPLTEGDTTFYVWYIPCPSPRVPFVVSVSSMPEPEIYFACTDGGIMDSIIVLSPLGGQYNYSIDGENFQGSPEFITGLTEEGYWVTVRNIFTGCEVLIEANCNPCPTPQDLILTDLGNGEICIGSGSYSVGVQFNRADSVVVTHDGTGTLAEDWFDYSPFTAVYTPAAGDVGNTVTLTFTIPVPNDCEFSVEKTITIDVHGLPTVTITATFADTMVCSDTPSTFNLTTMATTTGDSLEFSTTKDFATLASPVTAFSVNSGAAVKLYVRGFNTVTGCYTASNAIDSITLRVNPFPTVTVNVTGKDTVVCSDTQQTFNLTTMATASTGATVQFSEVKDFSVLIATPATYTVGLNTTKKVYIRANNTTTACITPASRIDSITITVYETPTVTIVATHTDTLVCSDTPVAFNLTTLVTTTGDSLEFSTTKTFATLATPITAFSVNSGAVVKLYVRGFNSVTGCYTLNNVIDSITLRVNPFPTVTINVTGKDTVVCSDTQQTFNLTTMATASTGATVQFSEVKDFSVLIATPATYTVGLNTTKKVYVRGNNTTTECITPASRIDSISITVHETPTIAVKDSAVCSNTTQPFYLPDLATTTGDSLEFCLDKSFTTLTPTVSVSSGTAQKVYVRGLNTVTGCYTVIDSITVTVNALPGISITPSFPAFNCMNEHMNLVLRTTSSCSSCTYLWTGGGTAPFNRDSLIVNVAQVSVTGTTFTVTITNPTTGCQSTDAVIITKDITKPIPPVVNTYQEFCEGAVVNDLNANAVDAIWYSEPTGGAPLPGNTLLVHDAMYYAATLTPSGCESTVRSGVKVGIIPASELPAPNVQNQTLCDDGTATVADILTDGSNGIVFFGPGGNELQSTDLLTTGTYRAIYRYGAGFNTCESSNSTNFTITLTSTQPNSPVIADQTFCEGAQIANIEVPNTGIVWYEDNITTTPLTPDTRLETGTYYAAQSPGGACMESVRVPVQITIGGTIPPPITYGPYTLCEGSTLGNINVIGYGVTWYNSSGVAQPFTTELPLGTHIFYAEMQGGAGCYGTRAQVIVTIERCGFLLDCSVMIDRIEDEDGYREFKYTHTTTDWDVAPAIMATLDSAQYIINGAIYSSGPDATLQGAIFPIGVSLVMVVGYLEDRADTCEFTVTVLRVCPTTLPDNEGNIYNVTKLAGLCWTSNFQATMYDDGTPIEWAKPYYSTLYPNSDSHTEIFGLLYTWHSAVGVPTRSGYVQGICPEGWHVPSTAEWNLLNQFPAEHLKSTDPGHWLTPGLDLYGFDSRPAGWYNSATDRFEDLYGFTGYWASDATGNQTAHYFSFTYYCDHILNGVKYKTDGLSVRCVMDME